MPGTAYNLKAEMLYIAVYSLFVGACLAAYNYQPEAALPTAPAAVNSLKDESHSEQGKFASFYNKQAKTAVERIGAQIMPTNFEYNKPHQFTNAPKAESNAAPTSTVATTAADLELYFPAAKYEYRYAVNDESTGDIKEHYETRDGTSVRGFYSLLDPDGFKRTVSYTADDTNGYNAIVKRLPYALKAVPTVQALKTTATADAIEDSAAEPQASPPFNATGRTVEKQPDNYAAEANTSALNAYYV